MHSLNSTVWIPNMCRGTFCMHLLTIRPFRGRPTSDPWEVSYCLWSYRSSCTMIVRSICCRQINIFYLCSISLIHIHSICTSTKELNLLYILRPSWRKQRENIAALTEWLLKNSMWDSWLSWTAPVQFACNTPVRSLPYNMQGKGSL